MNLYPRPGKLNEADSNRLTARVLTGLHKKTSMPMFCEEGCCSSAVPELRRDARPRPADRSAEANN